MIERGLFHAEDMPANDLAVLRAAFAQMPALYSQSHHLLARLPGLNATSLPGIARKAAVAVAAISVEDHEPEHLLLKSIVRDIAAL